MENKNLKIIFLIAVIIFCFFAAWEIYVPKSYNSKDIIIYNLERGMGSKDIATTLINQRIIKSGVFFRIFTIVTFQHTKLQAGKYELSPGMTIPEIVKKFVSGDTVKNKITIIEGWNLDDIGTYLEDKNVYLKKDFLAATKKDLRKEFEFLEDQPQNASLEGFMFPDTYYIFEDATVEDFLKTTLSNFDKKLSPDLRKEIDNQNKSVFQIITMASMVEKEVQSTEDKKIVSGILWKRIKEGIPLQVDATVNYITHKNDPKVSIKDTKIDSPYNTYKYYGLPLGPISNPGMDSIIAAIYPTKTDYWYYLSADGTGKIIFSRTLEEHNIAIAKYFK